MWLFYTLVLCAAFNIGSRVQGNLFTAIAGVEPLLQTHEVVINHLDNYISEEEQRLAVLRKNLELFKKEHGKAMADITNYLGNPLNIFTLIKRLTADLEQIEQSVSLGAELIKNVTQSSEVIYPSEEDLAGAATALVRLQDTYKLNVTELADGKLNNVAYSTPLTTSDCFELGRALFEQDDFVNSLPWMKQALRKYREQDQLHILLTDVNILEHISFIYYALNDIKSAVEWAKKILAVDPTNYLARFNINFYEIQMKNMNRNSTMKSFKPPKKKFKNYGLYEPLCRGDVDIALEESKRLTCRFLRENHPFLLLAPFKVEQVYMEPDIYLFYDVINDIEIKHIKNAATPKLQRAKVKKYNDEDRATVDYRISMSAWLSDDESPVVARLSRRVSHMTGLDMAGAENLQVGNYGIGGHYEPHYDFSLKEEHEPDNIIATVLFYMSSVAHGGATVFTKLGLSVFPVKGAAVFWMNLHPSGEGDLATRHAACPVLSGSKWVCNKWIHQNGQELLKPCNLEYQEEGINRRLPKPILKVNRQ